jgi:hypothetical protein
MRSSAGCRTAARCSDVAQSEAVRRDRLAASARSLCRQGRLLPDGMGSAEVEAHERGRGAIQRHAILRRERGPRAAPTLETGRALEWLRGLPMVHRFADLRRIRPRPLSCRALHQVSFAEVPPSGLVILPRLARRNIVATATPGRIRCARILPRARRGRQQVGAPGHRRRAVSSSTAALRRPSGLDRRWAANACEGRSVVCGFGYLAYIRPSPLILRSRLPASFSGSSAPLLPQGAGLCLLLLGVLPG